LHWMFFFIGLSWINNEMYWIAAFMFLLDILSAVANKKPVVFFSQKKIRYPSFIYRNIDWNELNNAMLKDTLLTLDFKNNKLIQQLLIDENVNEKDFNEFCAEQLEYGRMNRNK